MEKILKGAEPADMPVEQPYLSDLVVNLKAAMARGITISPSFLPRTDRVMRRRRLKVGVAAFPTTRGPARGAAA